MTVTVQINPDVEETLSARARSNGSSLEGYIQHLLEREATSLLSANDSSTMTGEQKARAFRAWAKSFPANLPLLSLDDVSREKIYSRE